MDDFTFGVPIQVNVKGDNKSLEDVLLDAMVNKAGEKTSDTHSSYSIYVKDELIEMVDILAAAQPRGFKTEFFNAVIAEGLLKYKDDFIEADFYKNRNNDLKRIKERNKRKNAELNAAKRKQDGGVEYSRLKEEYRKEQEQRRKDIEKKIRDKQEKSPL